jgi:DNA-binding PadR family transcriptional regulator
MRRLTRDPAELLPLKHSTYQVLLALGDGEAMHGYAIMQAVSAMTEGREAIPPGTLYAALARMVDEGLVTESTPKDDASGGPARRYYQRTRLAARSRARNPNGCGRSSMWPARRTCSEARSDASVSACAPRLSPPPP